jgi:hypothetical protein
MKHPPPQTSHDIAAEIPRVRVHGRSPRKAEAFGNFKAGPRT